MMAREPRFLFLFRSHLRVCLTHTLQEKFRRLLCGCRARCEEFVIAVRPLISVVDDDESVRESLPDLLREFGFAAEAYSSAEEFLASDGATRTKCLILDVAMPGMSGPDLQRELTRRRQQIPIVFITAYAYEIDRLRLLELGAVDCLSKPFSESALIETVNAALRES